MFKTSNSYFVQFSDSFLKDDNYQVFEVNEDVLNNLQNTGFVQIKGTSKNDDAFLTTDSKTYKLQRRLYSNSFLFGTREFSSSQQTNQLMVHSYSALKDHLIEIHQHTPQWGQIYSFLYQNRIKEEDSISLSDTGIDFNELLERFPLSEQELQNFFKKVNACNIGNRWFLVDEPYLIAIYHNILYEIRVKKLDIQEVIYPNTLADLDINHPKQLVLNAMQNYMELINVFDGKMVFKIKFDLLCMALAKEMLLTKDTYYWNEFKEIFKKMVETYCQRSLLEEITEEEFKRVESSCFSNFAMIVDENNLSSNYYLHQKVYIKYFNGSLLPSNVKERLNALFKIKKRFFYEEIVSWLKDLVGSSKEIDEILLKNTRVISEKISKNNYNTFCNTFNLYLKNITEDKNSKGQFYDVKFYVSKY